VSLARLNVSYTRVLAPIDGRVGKDEYTLGNLVDASSVLTSVVSIKRIYAGWSSPRLLPRAGFRFFTGVQTRRSSVHLASSGHVP
jgi:multidrug efflux pump subunit AcrA (membrane-fusion protein)